MCYKRKIKCEFDDSSQTCTQCIRRNLNCKALPGKGKRDSNKRYLPWTEVFSILLCWVLKLE